MPHTLSLRQSVNAFIQTFGLIDTWRTLFPSDKEYTWSTNKPPSARRLDYIFASESLACFVANSEIKTICYSDHRLVTTTFELSPFNYGKGQYKLNTALLSDANYCKTIANVIQETILDYNSLDHHLRLGMIKSN